MLKLPRLTAHVVVAGQPASNSFSRFWDSFANTLETAFNGVSALGTQVNTLASGVAFRDEDNQFTGENSFELAPDSHDGYQVRGVHVVGQQNAGWTAGTGPSNKAAFASYAGQTMGGGYSQTEAQATDNAARDVSQRVAALENALRAHGLIDG